MKAVIVDDEKDLCFLLERILRKEEFDTVSVNSIEEADRKLKDLNPNVIFLDNQLPDGLGIKYIPRIKEALPEVKVVVMTAYHTAGDKSEALKNGADWFLKKPLSRIVIEDTLNELRLIS